MLFPVRITGHAPLDPVIHVRLRLLVVLMQVFHVERHANLLSSALHAHELIGLNEDVSRGGIESTIEMKTRMSVRCTRTDSASTG